MYPIEEASSNSPQARPTLILSSLVRFGEFEPRPTSLYIKYGLVSPAEATSAPRHKVGFRTVDTCPVLQSAPETRHMKTRRFLFHHSSPSRYRLQLWGFDSSSSSYPKFYQFLRRSKSHGNLPAIDVRSEAGPLFSDLGHHRLLRFWEALKKAGFAMKKQMLDDRRFPNLHLNLQCRVKEKCSTKHWFLTENINCLEELIGRLRHLHENVGIIANHVTAIQAGLDSWQAKQINRNLFYLYQSSPEVI
ncbi:hypothetical protein YC2023_070563 [Brassica napus]